MFCAHLHSLPHVVRKGDASQPLHALKKRRQLCEVARRRRRRRRCRRLCDCSCGRGCYSMRSGGSGSGGLRKISINPVHYISKVFSQIRSYEKIKLTDAARSCSAAALSAAWPPLLLSTRALVPPALPLAALAAASPPSAPLRGRHCTSISFRAT